MADQYSKENIIWSTFEKVDLNNYYQKSCLNLNLLTPSRPTTTTPTANPRFQNHQKKNLKNLLTDLLETFNLMKVRISGQSTSKSMKILQSNITWSNKWSSPWSIWWKIILTMLDHVTSSEKSSKKLGRSSQT